MCTYTYYTADPSTVDDVPSVVDDMSIGTTLADDSDDEFALLMPLVPLLAIVVDDLVEIASPDDPDDLSVDLTPASSAKEEAAEDLIAALSKTTCFLTLSLSLLGLRNHVNEITMGQHIVQPVCASVCVRACVCGRACLSEKTDWIAPTQDSHNSPRTI